MGRNTKIDWCTATWNPVTGCLHGCEYCYAFRMAHRYAGGLKPDGKCHVLEEPYRGDMKYIVFKREPYPYEFDPTFHRYRLEQPSRWKKPQTIFVCSMADLFGDWVPDKWIRDVFDACRRAPQHRYLFLTKNPNRFIELSGKGEMPTDDNFWFGYSATRQNQLWHFKHADDCPVKNLFVSIEPILEPITPRFSSHCPADWVIIGAETGRRSNKVIPQRDWIERIAEECAYSGRPLFMKDSLRELMGDDFRQEFPWDSAQDARKE